MCIQDIQDTDNIFSHIFLNENIRIWIKIALKFIPTGPIDNKSALVQVMTWRRQTINWTNADTVHWYINMAPGGDELILHLQALGHQ